MAVAADSICQIVQRRGAPKSAPIVDVSELPLLPTRVAPIWTSQTGGGSFTGACAAALTAQQSRAAAVSCRSFHIMARPRCTGRARRPLYLMIGANTYGSPWFCHSLHAARCRGFHFDRRLRAVVFRVWTRAGPADQFDARSARPPRAQPGRARPCRQLRARRQDADGALGRRQSSQGEGRCTREGGAAEADWLRIAVLGQGAGNSRRGDRLPQVG